MKNKLFMKEVKVNGLGTLYRIMETKNSDALPLYMKSDAKFLVVVKKMKRQVYRKSVGIFIYDDAAKNLVKTLGKYPEYECEAADTYEAAKAWKYSRTHAFEIDLCKASILTGWSKFRAHIYSNNTRVEMVVCDTGKKGDKFLNTTAIIYPKPWQTIVADYHAFEDGHDNWNRYVLHGKIRKHMKMHTIY